MAEPFASQSLIFGVEGIDLKRTLDLIKPTRLARMTNVLRTEEGALIGRKGITPIVTAPAGSVMHTVSRLTGQDIGGNVTNHFLVLVDAGVYWGTSAGLTAVPFQGAFTPLDFPTIICPISYIDAPNAWERVWGVIPAPTTGGVGGAIPAFKVREGDGVTEILGTAPPTLYAPFTNIAQNTLAAEKKTTIDNCDAAGWTNNAGTGGAPANAADPVIKKEGANSLKLTTNAGGAPALYYNYWNKANALNLNLVGGFTASDDDIIHLWLMTDRPDLITEVRIYFVVAAAAFDLVTVPGTSATLNTDAYYKSFRPSDFTSVYEVTAATTSGAQNANTTLTTLNQLPVAPGVNPALDLLQAEQDPSIRASVQMAGGRGSWQEVGIIGFPLRRGEFGRIGTDSTRNWANVTGVVIAAQINTNAVANIWFDDIYLTGGSGPDTSAPGTTQYDYRWTNICIETGEESNPSDIQLVTNGGAASRPIDSLRRTITIQIVAAYPYFDTGLVLTFRQKFYRRGGTLGNNWYLLGQNAADGANFTDTLSDLAIVAAPTLEIDNDLPIMMQSIWGPVSGILFGVTGNSTLAQGTGGTLYWSKVDKPGSWPAAYTFEVCSVSEELMAGFTHAGQSFLFSREHLYTAIPDLSNAAIMNVVPTQCKKGLASRIAFCAYQAGVFFLAKDGVYFSPGPGGAEKNITDDYIEPIFRGETKSGYQPIDWAQPDKISMEIHESEVWLLFAGKGAAVGLAHGIISDGTGPAAGHVAAFGFAMLCADDGSGSHGTLTQADNNGNWSMSNVPVGSYSLVIFDQIDQAYRMTAPGSVVITESVNTNTGTNALNTLGAHPACPLAEGGGGSEEPLSDKQVWIFNTLYQFWRHHIYSSKPARFYSEPGQDLTKNSIMLVGGDGTPTLGYIPSESDNAFDFSTPLADCHIRTGALDQGIPRVTKLYGDAFIDVDTRFNTGVTITPYINNEAQALTSTTIVPVGTGRERFYIPIDEILARNISLDISWTPDGGVTTPPIIYQGGVSYTPQPDTSETRVTNWDTQGRLNDKWVKGVLFEVDTGGIAKSVNILADGVVQQNISVLAAGRRVLQFSFAQFRGRILRLAPTDTVQWIVYDFRWIFDEEPLSLVRWESQEVDHGFHGQQVPLFAHISIRSSSDVFLQLEAFRQDGTSVTKIYTLPNTLGAKVKLFVPFEATRGVLFKYLFFSEEGPFWLYREESTVRIQPWGQQGFIELAVFGNDDLDQPMRAMIDAGQASARSGAAHR